ncbi:MAG: hypothetical protein ABF966_09670 [Bifidobacterium psychraerophilum]|uniref:hypothetical protein n=1 Tax=Bifidobacterium psychraerophilum TaxID=218140 RepID=UPI0039EC2047
MAFHPDITRRDDVSLALDAANSAVRIASRQLTGNAGTVEIPNADGTSTIMGVGAGGSGIAPWVGDTTAPGKPLGISAESHNGAVWVSWDGTLDGGIPADFDHVQFTAVDGDKTVDMGQLKAAGTVTAAELTAGDTVTITAIAYDNAHAADGSSAPNASVVSDPVTVVVQSAVDAKAVHQAQDDAQSALDKAGKASEEAVEAKTTADGKNKIFSSDTQPDSTGLAPGDLWFQLNSSQQVTGIQVWNGSTFVDYLVVANEILVAGSVGTTQIKNGAITTDLLTSNAVTAIKIAAQTITGDKLNVGSVASAIMTSNLFKTSGASNYTIVNDSGITVYKNGTPYSHMGSDATYGLQAWDPNRSTMVDVSSQIFGTNYAYETTDLKSPDFAVTKVGANWSPWGNATAPSMKINSPTGRFIFIWDARYIGALHDDVMGSWINLNVSESSSGGPWVWSSGDVHANFQNISGDYGGAGFSQNSPGFTMVSLTPNKDYWLFFSHRSLHYMFTGQKPFTASGHCNQRTLIALPA